MRAAGAGGRRAVAFGEVGGEAFEAVAEAVWEGAVIAGEAGHVKKAVVAEEVEPGWRPVVGLVERADECVAFEAEGLAVGAGGGVVVRGDGVEGGEEVGGVSLGAVGERAAGGDVLDEDGGGGLGDDAGDGELGPLGEGAEHVGFDGE